MPVSVPALLQHMHQLQHTVLLSELLPTAVVAVLYAQHGSQQQHVMIVKCLIAHQQRCCCSKLERCAQQVTSSPCLANFGRWDLAAWCTGVLVSRPSHGLLDLHHELMAVSVASMCCRYNP